MLSFLPPLDAGAVQVSDTLVSVTDVLLKPLGGPGPAKEINKRAIN